MPIDIKHLGAYPARVEPITFLWQTVQVPVDKSSGRAVRIILPGELQSQRFLDLLDRKAPVDDDLNVADRFEQRQLFVIFVLNLTHDLFEDVLDGNQPGGATVFVGHDGNVDAVTTQLPEEIVETPGDEQDSAVNVFREPTK